MMHLQCITGGENGLMNTVCRTDRFGWLNVPRRTSSEVLNMIFKAGVL